MKYSHIHMGDEISLLYTFHYQDTGELDALDDLHLIPLKEVNVLYHQH